MTSEAPVERSGDPKQEVAGSQRHGNQQTSQGSDLTEHAVPKNVENSRQKTANNQMNSPTKRNNSGNESNPSPSKGKNRRKNEARRRSANVKQQATINTEQSERANLERPPQPPNSREGTPIKDIKETDSNDPTAKETLSEQQHPPETSSSGNVGKGSRNSNRLTRHVGTHDVVRECKGCKGYKDLKEQLDLQKNQILGLVGQGKQQTIKIKELDAALQSTTRTCNQLEKLLQQELVSRSRLEAENDSLSQTVSRLKTQLSAYEKSKLSNDELIRVLNATLMERETEVSILKLKLTRIQTNPSSLIALNSASSVSSVKNDPCQVYVSSGRSNSEFDRKSYIRSSMIAEAASVRSSTTQLRSADKDASVWATVPEELTPSKRPQMLERSFQPVYSDYNNPYGSLDVNQTSTPILRDRRYRTLPRSLKSPSQELNDKKRLDAPAPNDEGDIKQLPSCQVTNLDDTNSTSQSSGNKTNNDIKPQIPSDGLGPPCHIKENVTYISNNRSQETFNTTAKTSSNINSGSTNAIEPSHYSTISKTNINSTIGAPSASDGPPSLPARGPTTPIRFSSGLKKIFDKFRRSDSSNNSQSKTDITNLSITPMSSPFKRGANRSTMVASPNDIRAQMSPIRQAINFQTDKPFAEWDTDMLVDWMTMIGLSMYTNQCRRWVRCGAHIMNATPGEVDKGLGITNHLHRKKLRLAISELNGDCDKITKAAAKIDYLWVARWLDDMGLPQYKEAFINARVDGRVLNYLTVEDLVSMGVKSVLHHASIRCGIKVLRSINFDLQMLKRRATSDEIDQMSSMRQQMDQIANERVGTASKQINEAGYGGVDVPLWTCHRVMEWLRLIDFAEFAPNLRGSGVHGGLIVFEDGFNFDTMCSLLSIPIGRTLLRRHLATFFKDLIGQDLAERKHQYQNLSSNQQLNPLAEIKTPKKSQLWFTKLKSSKVGQDGMDEYLCPMYPVEPQIINSRSRKSEVGGIREDSQLSKIPESVNV